MATQKLHNQNTGNMGAICTTGQVEAGRGERVAMRWLAPGAQPVDFTFLQLDLLSNRFANVLTRLGLQGGEVLNILLPKSPELFIAFLGSLKRELITGALFFNFGDDALRHRLGDAGTRVVLTRRSHLKRLERIRRELPRLEFVLVTDTEEDLAPAILSYPRLMRQAADTFPAPATHPDTPALLHYTSSCNGQPRGVLHRHGAIAGHARTTRDILGLRDGDVFWCTADQGWVTGVAYGILGPWSQGLTQIHYGGGFMPEKWFEILERERVNVWYTAPTALRMLMREDPALYRRFDLSALRHISSVGEMLKAAEERWSREVLGKPVYDTYFQTETGSILIAGRPGLPVKPGSMGRPAPGIEAAILDDTGRILPPGRLGNLCFKASWPAMFLDYLNQEDAYRERFREGWYFTGDIARTDPDGYFWFCGRRDDVINTGGHLVSPAEVEDALRTLPEVAAVGVTGAPDELFFEKVVAFATLRPGHTWTKDLELKLCLHVANRVSSIAAPRDVIECPDLPRDESGEVSRRKLRARSLEKAAGVPMPGLETEKNHQSGV